MARSAPKMKIGFGLRIREALKRRFGRNDSPKAADEAFPIPLQPQDNSSEHEDFEKDPFNTSESGKRQELGSKEMNLRGTRDDCLTVDSPEKERRMGA